MTKKQKKQLFMLLIILVVAVGVLLCVLLVQKRASKKEEAAEEEKVLFTAEYEDITAISFVTKDGESITLEHVEVSDESADASGDGSSSLTWVCSEYPQLTLDADAVYNLVYELESISYESCVEDYDGEDYGFDTPENVISIYTDDTSYTFTIGMENAVLSQYYMMPSDTEDEVYLISSDIPEAFLISFSDLQADESADE